MPHAKSCNEDTAAHGLEARYVTLPAHERVLDRLADLLFAADETLATLNASDMTYFTWVRSQVQEIYDTVNEVMTKLSD